MTAQLSASITVSAVCPVPPISAMRWSRMSRSPRTMESRLSIVTSVPFFMRIDDISQTVYVTKRHKKHKSFGKSLIICAFCAFLWPDNLLGGGLYVRGFGFFANWKTEFDLHVALDLSQSLGIFS